jgi:branched-chain amino acid transport system ATP-binding protein
VALLEVKDVVVRFGGVVAVNEATMDIEPGLVTGLIGPNGAGKTTLFNVVSGLQPPNVGRIIFDGKDITKTSTYQRARMGIARTFQRLEAFGSLSVLENVLAAVEIHQGYRRRDKENKPRDVARRLLERVGVAHLARHQADSVPTGAARLVELARALAIAPRIILLDEPSSGLGEDETDALGELLRELATEGMAVLMVEHDMELVMGVCDTIYAYDFGRVISHGTPEQIRRDPRVQEAYLGPQLDTLEESGAQTAEEVPA